MEQIIIREFEKRDLSDLIFIWNEVVEEGVAFPQEEYLDHENGQLFFDSQSYTGVADFAGRIAGLYILHPNNIGRCGHICNASYAVRCFKQLGTIPAGFRMKDGYFENICLYYMKL